jgi:two-component system, NarL family, sensor histidine kinase EvgS
MRAFVALAGMLFVALAWAQDQRVALTDAERGWIAEHPVVRVGLSREFPPYYFFGSNPAQPHGFAVETLDLWAQRTGLRFEFRRYASFANTMAALKDGEVDMTPITTPIEAQRTFATFTRPAFVSNLVLAARRDVPDISATANFGGRSIAVEQGPGIEALMRERYPAARLQPYPDAETALRAVSTGEADLFIGYQQVVVYHVEKALLANIELRMNLGPGATPLGPAVRRDLPLLSAILDKAIASVSTADASRLAERWLPAGSTMVQLPTLSATLNGAEQAWVKAHGRIRVGYDASFAPITLRGPLGEFRGLGADVLKLAARKAGLEIEQELGGSFAEVYAKGVASELDVIVGMARAPQRRADYDFIGPFISVPTAIVMRTDDGPAITETQDIGLRKVALLREHFLIPELRARHPGIHLVEFERQDQVLTALDEGAADVALGNIQVINELTQNRFGGRLHITGTVRDGDSELFLAVPRHSPELARILRSGMEAINDSEMAAMRSRWLMVEVSHGPSWRALLQIVIPIAAAALLYLWLLRRGNRRLRASREREMLARALAEENAMARGRFLAYLSHELRGGLAAVASGAEMLRTQANPALQERMLGAIVDSVNGLRKVLDMTLAYEQTSQSAMTLQARPTELERWWLEAIAPGQLAAQRKGLALETHWDGPMPTVEIDPARLQQVLQNLIGNAVKFTERGRVAVTGSLRHRGDGPRELVLEVRDSGPGIDDADRERLFQPYAQGVQGLAQRDGAGLGLAICRQIVQSMLGRIEVDSALGAGACFRVIVPIG